MSDLPPALKTACTSGDLTLTKTLYNNPTTTKPLAKTPALSQMAILSTKNAHFSILSYCFFEACDSGSIAIFRLLLDNGLDVNKYLELSGGPLTTACYSGNVDLATFLLDRGADPNNGYCLGEYESLVWAILGYKASLDMVRLLLARGTVVKGTGALIAAAENGNLGAVNLLLENGDADLEEVEDYGAYDGRKLDDQGTALYKAAAEGHLEIVDVLLSQGANGRFRDRKGRSVADVAEARGHQDIMRSR